MKFNHLLFLVLLMAVAASAVAQAQLPAPNQPPNKKNIQPRSQSDMANKPYYPTKKQTDKELALIKQYYIGKKDSVGYTKYLLTERKLIGTNLYDLDRARKQVLVNLHIPIPQ